MKEMTFNEAAKMCHDYHQPITISIDGNSKVYLMSEETFKDYEDAKLCDEVLEGLEQIKNGQLLDGETVFKELEREYGL